MIAQFCERFSDLPHEIQRDLEVTHSRNPFFSRAFLNALESCGCVGPGTAWQAVHWWLEASGEPVMYMPVYLKRDSWGEFVFDQNWAQAYQRYGLAYYPKLVTAIPFIPSVGPRWWLKPGADAEACFDQWQQWLEDFSIQTGVSSWHLLFSEQAPPAVCATEHHWLRRRDVQFHWRNHGYSDFEDFLATFKSRKRKSIRQERQQVQAAGVELRRVLGAELTAADWHAFYDCYCQTYRERGMPPYLNLEFFRLVGAALADQIMMVQGWRQGRMMAAALCLFDEERLYGRYWGSLEPVRFLHFEACFYQGIEFCIERGLKVFDPGTQGEHKLLRGFEPTHTTSYHWIADARFRPAISDFLQAEAQHIDQYAVDAANYLPYRQQADREKD